jgi:release factor glutamine methyltransferase
MVKESAREWCVVDLLKTTTDFFAAKEVDEPRMSAELLLAHLFGEDRLWLYLNHNRPVSGSELDEFRGLCRDRLDGRPVQYIIGEQFFYGKPFVVDERVLIPRPETELLVEHAAEFLTARKPVNPECRLLDIGTGSGCIAVTLAGLFPYSEVTALDRSEDALDVARGNALKHGVLDRILFFQADMFDPDLVSRFSSPFDVIVSNPPYIPECEWDGLQKEVRGFEPKDALITPDGSDAYLAICRTAASILKPGGALCLEIHAEGAEMVRSILASEHFGSISVLKDYSGFDRIVSGTFG